MLTYKNRKADGILEKLNGHERQTHPNRELKGFKFMKIKESTVPGTSTGENP